MNQLKVIFLQAQKDRRYRLMVNLIRADRPTYWTFKCFNCGSSVCHIQNKTIVDISDFYDPQDVNNGGVSKDCKGTQDDGRACPYTYFFNIH